MKIMLERVRAILAEVAAGRELHAVALRPEEVAELFVFGPESPELAALDLSDAEASVALPVTLLQRLLAAPGEALALSRGEAIATVAPTASGPAEAGEKPTRRRKPA